MDLMFAREFARGVLDAHWDKKLPVNAVQIAYKAGMNVVYDTSLSDKNISGKTVNKTIKVNPLESTMRQRFTIFHEMGHILMEHGDMNRMDSDAYGKESSPKELAANAFAIEMALPINAVSMLKEIGMSVREIADEFDVSDRIMELRLKELGYA